MQLNEIEKRHKTLAGLNKTVDTKLKPQSPEATYMWAYLAYKILKGKGLYLDDIYQYGAGLTPEQMHHAK